MFSLRHSYPGYREEIKFSLAGSNAHFKGKTKGLAVKYVSRGQENYLVDGRMLHVNAGQFIVLPEQMAYQTFTSRRESQNCGTCIDLNSDKFLGQLPDSLQLDLLYGVIFSCKGFAKLPGIIEGLSDQEEDIGDVYEELLAFAHDLGEIKELMRARIKKTTTQKEILSKLFKTKNFIHENYSQQLNLEQLGKHAGLSHYHLNRLFKRCFGQTPFELQVDLKINRAMQLLETDTSLAQIAFNLGYNDQAAFSNQFKKQKGESPSSFRKRL